MYAFSLIAEFNMAWVVAGSIFLAVAFFGWWLSDYLFNSSTRSESRLDQLNQRSGGPSVTKNGGGSSGIKKLLEKATPAVSDRLQPKKEKDINTLKEKLSTAGFRTEGAAELLITLKFFSAILGVFLGGGANFFIYGITVKLLVYTAVVGYVFYLAPELILGFIGAKRKEKIFLGLPDALDLMVVCVEAGLGLDQAMRRVADELGKSHPVIAHEFEICNQQLQMGSTRETVLTELGERNGVDDLKTLSSVMIQVDRFGTSVGKALRTQSDAMRVRRRQIAEEKAAKTAVKLIFPLVLFIFPGIFVVLVGPAAIRMINETSNVGF